MCVERWLEVHPYNLAVLILLHRQDVCNEMVPIEELMVSKDVQNIKDGGAILLDPQRGRAGRTSRRRGRGSQFHLLVRKGKDRGGKLLRGHRDDDGKKARS